MSSYLSLNCLIYSSQVVLYSPALEDLIILFDEYASYLVGAHPAFNLLLVILAHGVFFVPCDPGDGCVLRVHWVLFIWGPGDSNGPRLSIFFISAWGSHAMNKI